LKAKNEQIDSWLTYLERVINGSALKYFNYWFYYL